MDIKELKEKIENNNLDDGLLIWEVKGETSKIISEQYINRICQDKNLNKKYINSFNDIPDESFVIDDNLYIIKPEKVENNLIYYQDNKLNSQEIQNKTNCIIISQSIKDKRKIVFPELEDWQVVDYVNNKSKGLNHNYLMELVQLYNKNYNRFILDLDKISLFNDQVQEKILKQMINDDQFNSITNLTIWDLTNSLIRKEKDKVLDMLKVIDYVDINIFGLINSLYNSFKNVINIQMNPTISCEQLGINSKQYYVIKKYNCNHYSKEELIRIFKMITSLEYKIKYESLDKESVIDYIIVKVLGE